MVEIRQALGRVHVRLHARREVQLLLILGVRSQIEVGPVGDAFELFDADRIAVHQVDRRLGVVCQVGRRDVVLLEILAPQAAHVHPPVDTLLHPAPVPLLVLARAHEILDFHLLELAHPEDEVSRRDLVAEGLSNLRDPERQLAIGRVEHILEVHKDPLRRFGAQVRERLGIRHRSHLCTKHHVERSRLGEILRPAVRTGAVLQMVGAETSFAVAAVDHRIDKRFLVP